MKLRIFPPEGILETTVALPASKSVEARDMMMRAYAGADVKVADDVSVDIKVLAEALAKSAGEIDVKQSGTALRFLTAYFASKEGAEAILDGDESLRRRPMAQLVDLLRQMGAEISYLGEEGHAPVKIAGHRLSGGNFNLQGLDSSQFVSAILMAAPGFTSPLKFRFVDDPASLPYIRMTESMMKQRGIDVEMDRDGVEVKPGSYRVVDQPADPDWSAASFWYEIAALTAGWVTITGLRADSLQGDRSIAELGPRVGVLTEFTEEGAELSATPDIYSHLDVDMADTPDLVPPLAVTACAVGMPFRFTGVRALRHKESDRLGALCEELGKLGFVLEIEKDEILQWDGTRRPVYEMPVLDSHGDHRMAMALAPLSVYVPGIVIDNTEVVDKSYPGYWQSLANAGFTLEELTE